MADLSAESPAPAWWTAPGETDTFAYVGLVVFLLFVLLLLHLYARFDRYAEHRSADTPLRTTVPTLLTIALAFEVFPPLSHFSILLPLALIAAALARDFMLWSHAPDALPRSENLPVETPDGWTAETQPDAGGQQRNASVTEPDAAGEPGRPIGDGPRNA